MNRKRQGRKPFFPAEQQKKKGRKTMYIIANFYTDEIIDAAETFEEALKIANNCIDSYITLENDDEILYMNVELPFC